MALEWLLIIGGVIAFFAYAGRGNRGKAAKATRSPQRKPNRPPVPAAKTSTASFGSADRSRGPSTARWVSAGEAVKVGPFHIDAGMFYLGASLPNQGFATSGNCVVDPGSSLPREGLDPSGSSMSYWPSYQGATPTARRTYLDWLAGGREDPDIGIGYVFLFFYGLERRLFVDNALSEAPAIVAEVRRLLDVHGHNGSFRTYATRLLEAVELFTAPRVERPLLTPDLRSGYEMPMAARVYLGHRLGSAEPLDAEDALLWVLGLPDTSLKTPATRCFDELVALWKIRFAERHPQGLQVKPPKTPLRLEYRPASNGFVGRIDVTGETGSLPDITVLSAPVAGLRDLLNACTEELAPYSRLLGRNPGARGSLDAEILLPKGLAGAGSAGTEVGSRVDALFDGKSVTGVTLGRLADALYLDIAGAEKLSTGMCNQLGAYMDHLDIGFEPDRRYGSGPLRPEAHVVLFKAPGGGKVDGDAPAFSAARAMVDVAALAAGADDRVDGGEIDSITADIRNVPGLSGIERARLIAYASSLLKDTSLHRFALNKLKTLDEDAKKAVVKSAAAAILADGHASPAEVKFVERLYKAMDLPEDGVYSALHRGTIVVDEPVAVSRELRAGGVAIPAPPSAPSAGSVRIDTEKLERLKSETSAVSALLAGIFVEEDAAAAATPGTRPTEAVPSRFAGLDAAHAELLGFVLRTGDVGRDDFDGKAASLRLLPDGAIERINDWGFDRFEEPIIEGEDRLSVAPHVIAELTEAEAAE